MCRGMAGAHADTDEYKQKKKNSPRLMVDAVCGCIACVRADTDEYKQKT